MNRSSIARRWAAFAALVFLTAAPVIAADEALVPATNPATQSSSPALALLERVSAEYGKLQSARFDGRVLGRFDVAGEQKNDEVPFTSSFRAPNRFRHESKGDVLLGSTGEKAYAYLAERNIYLSVDAPRERAPLSDWPRVVANVLQQQNPSMLLALTKNSIDELKELGDSLKVLPDTNVDGAPMLTLHFDMPPDHEIVTMLFDPKTSLLRQARFDLRQPLQKRGATDVKLAEVTVDYTLVTPSAAVDDAQFAWSPPPGATQAPTSSPQIGEDNPVVAALVGKPAPDFTLGGMDDKPVKLSSLKGSVVLLDFWATWCPPCITALPGLDALNKELAPKGLKAFAVNQEEDKADVKAFVAAKKFTLPVLLDTKGEAGKLFGVSEGIPITIVIGKDGVVKRGFVGTNEEIEHKIRASVVKELGL